MDEEDCERVSRYKWHPRKPDPNREVYYAKSVKQDERGIWRPIHLHRFIAAPDADETVDHKDGNGLNNARANLRRCLPSQNGANRKRQCNNTSGYKGVRKNRLRWQAKISVNGSEVYLGSYPTPEDAARAYDSAARKAWGDFARLNFPEGG